MCLRFFSISFNGNHGFNENDISNWVTTAIDRSIEDLDLNFYFKFSPPACLFNSRTLIKLNMDSCVITSMSVLHAPCLPTLKELQLRDLKFSAEFLKLLILGCPALERLFLSVARDNDVVSCDISSSTLKWLELECKESPDNMLTQKVVLRVPALEFIRIHYPSCEIDVEDKFPNLVEADVHLFHVYKRDDIFHDSFPRIIKLLSNVRILRLNTDSKRPMTMALQAEFPNLTELEISSTSFEFTLLQSFMDHSVNLEIISFGKRYMRHNEHLQVSWNEPQHVPKCFMSSLKKIVIKGYTNETELDMVKYFLRNGEIMEKIEIHCSEDEDDYNSKYWMIQKILVLRRTSPRCEVSFS